MSGSWSGFPPPDIAVPDAVMRTAAGRRVTPVWVTDAGGITCQLGDGGDREFIKWSPRSSGIDLSAEVARLRWVAPHATVPEVADEGEDDAATWFVSRGLPGENAVTPRWKADPRTAVTVIGASLRRFHDAVPVDDCPFSWSIEERLAQARVHADTVRPVSPPSDAFAHLTIDEAFAVLSGAPTIDHLVVCHGDTCAPNTLIEDDGTFAGHVDLGDMGVADRWADLAIATWSTGWNYGDGWEGVLLDAYGIEEDAERTQYYRLLWDLGS